MTLDALRLLREPIAIPSVNPMRDPESVKPGAGGRAVRVAREAGVTVIEVGAALKSAPERGRFLSLDKIHMTEPYHRLMAKRWLGFLAGTGAASADKQRR
ncbi:MAG TPA: hypothetical protein VKB12_04920 [Pyrinomonadaceae bacterium]|nr:hypothetical protein [Pyrinomonadaceae bacterium]